MGYRFKVKEDDFNLKYEYTGEGKPPNEAKALFEVVKKYKGQIICYMMVEESLKRINEEYKGGVLDWIKRTRFPVWKHLTDIESIINSCVFRNDQAGLTKALKEYERLVVDTICSWYGGAAPLFKIKS
jgi:hypothetical protein